MPPTLTPQEAVARIADACRRGGRTHVLVPGGPAEALALVAAWRAAPETAAGLTFAGLLTPGVNTTDYAALHESARLETALLSPDWRASFEAGRVRLFPQHYSAAYQRLSQTPFAAVIAHLSPPGADGLCTTGLSGDIAPLLAAGCADDRTLAVALVNHAMPPMRGAPRLDLAQFDLVVETDAPPAAPPDAGGAAAAAIIDAVAARIPDGATVQTGIGRLPGQILAALADRRGLRLHSGLLGAGLEALLDAGALAEEEGAITTGMVLGSPDLSARLRDDPRLRLAAPPITHGLATLARLPRLRTVNAALEIDLLGQINGEFIGGRQHSGVGGLLDFIRGAALNPEGEAIVMLQAEGRGGAARIVPRLEAPAVTVPRADAPTVITEHGAAALGGLDLDARAEAIIALAAPAHRAGLAAAWAEMRRAM